MLQQMAKNFSPRNDRIRRLAFKNMQKNGRHGKFLPKFSADSSAPVSPQKSPSRGALLLP